MDDTKKSKKDLILELQNLRNHIADLEKNNGGAKDKKSIRERTGLLEMIYDLSPYAIMAVDLQGYIIDCNNETVRLFGYKDKKELIGIVGLGLLQPVDKEKDAENMKIAFKAGSTRNIEYSCITNDGREITVDVSSSVMNDSAGNPEAFIIIAQDITLNKNSEKALRESEEKYRRIVENSSDVIMLTRPDGIISYLSPACSYVLGYEVENLVGTGLNIFHPEDADKVLEIFGLALEGAFGSNFEYRIITKEGETKWISHSWSPIFMKDKLQVIVSVIRDVNDFKDAQEEKERLEEQLRQSQKMEAIGRLAGGVAHDFNNLLTAITGYADLLLFDLQPGDSQRKGIGEIKNAANRAAALTRQLLAFSRRQPLQQKVLELNRLISNLENMLKRLMGEDIRLVTILEPDLEKVRADPGQIEQILMNLSVNARDAMPEGGVLKIKTENVLLDEFYCQINREARPGRYVKILVEDNGVGISNDAREHIFEPFYTTKGHEGTGLGLSVVYGIVKQHGGWINVYSEPGHGAVFNIYMPSFSEEIKSDSREKTPFKKSLGAGQRILIVEDDEMVRVFASNVIKDNGYIVFEATNAEEAFKCFNEEKGNFDLIIVDSVLPDKSGLRLVEKLIPLKEDLQVLLCSGYTEDRSQWSAIKEKGFRFLQKPYTIEDLLSTIASIIKEAG